MALEYIDFIADDIKINQIFRSKELEDLNKTPVKSEKIRKVYGDDLKFPETYPDRPYIFSSFVISIDGRLAYHDEPSAFYVAAKNEMAGNGKDTDFWILNALRAVCDASLIGGNSLGTDDEYAMYCMDKDIAKDRVAAGLPEFPLNIVVSLDATDVPMEHQLLKNKKIPTMLTTSPKGLEYLKENFQGEISVVTQSDSIEDIKTCVDKAGKGILPVLITGENGSTDTKALMKILREIGIGYLLIESPGYGHHLTKVGMMDEFFLNKSGVYIGGGDTMVLGKADKGFLSDSHPHMKALSIHYYNEFFMYFRYKFDYGFVK